MDTGNPSPEPELTPPERFAETRSARICSRIVFALVMLYSAVVIHFFLARVPDFWELFKEMDLSSDGLPTITSIMLSPVFPACVAILALASIAKEFAVRNRLKTLIINGVHLVLLFAVRELTVTAVLQPLITPMVNFA